MLCRVLLHPLLINAAMNPSPADAQPTARAAREPQATCIDVTDPRAVEQWTRQLGVSEFDLRCAVAAAGDMAADVRSHLGLR